MRKIPKVIAVLLLLFETLFSPGLVSAIEREARDGGEPGYWCYADPNSKYEKFTMVAPNNDKTVVYCYNHDKKEPVSNLEDAEKNCKYERFGFYDGMTNLGNNRGNPDKINEVAAALMVGYPNDGLGAPMNEYAEKCYRTFKDIYGSYREPNYNLDDFKREMTQAAIWQIDDPSGRYITKSDYAKAIYDYAKKYPLDKDTAYATKVKLIDGNAKEINLTNPLVVNPDTLKTQLFSMTGYNGMATLDSLPEGYEVIDNSTQKSVSGIKPNQKYYIKANNKDNTQFEVKLKIMTMRDSYFYQPMTTYWDLQNMVSAKVTRDEFKAPIILMNKPVKEVSINKKDNSGIPVSNAKLVILDSKNQEVDSWITNGETHKVSLVDGSYTLKETKVPEGYKQASPIQFKVENGKLYVNNSVVDAINMIDEKIIPEKPVQKTEVSIEKVDGNKTPVNGAELTITNARGDKLTSWITDGTVHKVSLADGEYTLTETKVPEGYKKADPIKFTVKEGQVLVNGEKIDVITMVDKKVIPSTPIVPAKHKVVLSKQNVAGKEIAGAKLTLTTGGKEVDSWTSEAGKNHEFFVNVNKEYTLTEKEAPEGYEIAESITFRVTEAGKVEIKNGSEWKELKDNKVIMVDEYKKEKPTGPEDKPSIPSTPVVPAKHKVVLSKQNVAGKEIAGAKLTLTAGGKEVDSWTSEAGKNHEFFVDVNKEYTLTEKEAPEGYEIAESITFRVTEAGKVEIKNGSEWKELKDNKVIMVDEYKKEKPTGPEDKPSIPSTPVVPAKHKVVLSKQNVAGKEIAGAKLTLTTGGKEVDSWTSEAGKNHEFFVNVNKEYTLTEKEAPEGYEIAESITFRVTEAGKVEIKNGSEWKELKDNKVIMVDEYKKEKPTEKSNAKKDLGLIVTDNSNNFSNTPHNNNGNKKGSKFELPLPQTGNRQMKYLPIIGGVLLVIVIFGLMLGLRRKQK